MSLFENPDNLLLLRNLLNPKQNGQDESDLEDDEESLIKNKISKTNSPLRQKKRKKNKLKFKTFFPTPAPGCIGAQPTTAQQKSNKSAKKSPYSPIDNSETEKQPSTLEEWQQQHEAEDQAILDSRKCPSYTMTYRQAVGTEDVFLQMGNRTNATASCEDLVVDVLLPNDDTPSDKMQLNITASEVVLSTPIHHLKLPLQHKVNVDRCRAKYQAEEHKLTLFLRLQRELDFVNF